jgi:hypothetical protein
MNFYVYTTDEEVPKIIRNHLMCAAGQIPEECSPAGQLAARSAGQDV